MPSLHSLIGLCVQKEAEPQSVLRKGVDAKQVFYVLDPDANLGNSQNRFKEWFSRWDMCPASSVPRMKSSLTDFVASPPQSKPDWQGVCGIAPDSGQLEEAVATEDLYMWVV